MKKDSGFREPRSQETRKTRSREALEHSGKGPRKAENKAFMHSLGNFRVG